MSGLPLGWADVPLGSLLNFKYGKALPDKERSGKGFPVYGSNGVVGWHSHALTTGTTIVIGRKGSVGALQFSNTPCSPIDTTYYIDEAPGHQFRFWFYRLKSLDLASLNKSTAIPGLSRGDAYQILVALPPLAEQKRIADKLDIVLTRVDAVNTRLARVAPLLKRFRQSILAAPTSEQKTEKWRLDRRLPAPKAHELGTIIRVSSGKGLTAKQMVGSGGIPVFGGNGITGYHDQANTVEPTLLIGRVGYYCGSVHLTPPIAWVTDNALIVRHDPKIVQKNYLFFALQAIDLRQNDSSTAQPVISGQKIYGLLVVLPHFDEQTEIVRRVETLFAFADRLEARLAQAQTAATRLTPALLAKAFRGELVPQDPNDEPAAELLRRLQAQRATAVSASKTGTGRGRGRTAVAAPAVTEN